MSIAVLRLLPISVSLMGIPVAYALGFAAGGRFTACVAALLLAISPQQVWYAQELKPYAPLAVLACVSFYSLLRASQDNRLRWWALNLVANALTLWMYAMGGLIFVVQGLFLLLFSRCSWKTMTVWCAAQCCVIAPWAFWALQTPFVHSFREDPSLTRFFRVAFLDDVVAMHQDLVPAWKTNKPEALSGFMQRLLPFRRVLDGMLSAILLLVALHGLLAAFRLFARRFQSALNPEDRRSLEVRGLLLLIAIVPAAVLGMLEWILRMPFLGSMYVMYDAVGLYVLLGLAIRALPNAKLRGCALAVLAALYAYQLALLLPDVTRTNYRDAAARIQAEGDPDDLCMNYQWLVPDDCLGIYLGEAFENRRCMNTFQGACDLAYEYFKALPPERRTERAAWFAAPLYLFQLMDVEADTVAALRNGLRERGLTSEPILFPGHWNLCLFKISADDDALPPPPFSPVPMPFQFNETRLVQDLKLEEYSEDERREALYVLRRHVFNWPIVIPFITLLESLDMTASGQPLLGRAAALRLVEEVPSFGMAHYAAGLACFALGNAEEAKAHLESAFRLHQGLRDMMGAYVEALLSGDARQALEEAAHFRRQGHVYVEPCMRALAEGCLAGKPLARPLFTAWPWMSDEEQQGT